MTVPGNLSSPLLATAADAAAAAAGPTRSLRFNSGDTAHLSKTFSSAGNRRTWTVSFWIKKVKNYSAGNFYRIFGQENATHLYFYGDNINFDISNGGSAIGKRWTSQVFRDNSAWFHVVAVCNTPASTASERMRLYINGSEVTSFGTSADPSQNADTAMNTANQHTIGYRTSTQGSAGGALDAYIADFYFIDGSALDPTSFGAFDDNGVWQAAAYSGTFGTNGFHLKFADASSDSALGTDSSGNDNTWTVNNITAKSPGDYDSPKHFDVLTYTGTGASNAISSFNFSPDFVWFKERGGTKDHNVYDTLRGATKELFPNGTGAENTLSTGLTSFDSNGFTLGSGTRANGSSQTYVAWAWNAGDNSNKTYTVKVVDDSGNKYRFDDFGTSAVTLDLAEGSTYVFDQSDSSNSGHPLRFSTTSDGTHNSGSEYTTGVTTTGTPGSAGAKTTIVVGSSVATLYYYCSSHSGMGGQANTNDTEGASNFDGSIQAKVKANQDYGFSVVTYTGIGSTATVGHGLGVAPSLYIVKARTTTAANSWRVFVSALGNTKQLFLEDTASASTNSNAWNNTSPTSSVFSVGSLANESSGDYVAYCWSEISGFSKFGTYTGGSGTQSITGLGFKPKFVMVKRTDSTSGWFMLDSKRGPSSTDQLYANLNLVEQGGPTISFDADGFTFQSYTGSANTSGGSYIYMAFAGTPAGEEDDSVFDAPTNGTQTDSGAGGEVSGNYPTLNPLAIGSDATLSNGNLDVSYGTGSTRGITTATIGMSSGKWYWEATFTASSATNTDGAVGITTTASGGTNYPGHQSTSWGYLGNGNKYNNGSGSSYGDTFGAGDVIGIAFDADGGNLYFYKNGVAQNSGTAAYTSLTSGPYFAAVGDGSTNSTFSASFNFGQREFAFDAPSGHKALNTASMSAATIADGSDYFDVKLWTGDGNTGRDITGYSFSPDLVWIKSRSNAEGHSVNDTVRGANKSLASESTSTENTQANKLTAFNSDGFELGDSGRVNYSNYTYVGWAWDAGSSTVSNTDGATTSSVRANQTAGFSIVKWTNPSAATTVGHGLNAVPSLLLTKGLGTCEWQVYHKDLGNDYKLYLDANNSRVSSSVWSTTTPTSSVFNYNDNRTTDFVSYCFAPVAGYSAFGSYTGTGSGSSSAYNYCGFRPRLVVVKRTDSSSQWSVYDTERDPSNAANKNVWWDTTEIEYTSNVYKMDIYSNGFKMRNSHSERNASGGTYIWLAFAENPFQANGGLAR